MTDRLTPFPANCPQCGLHHPPFCENPWHKEAARREAEGDAVMAAIERAEKHHAKHGLSPELVKAYAFYKANYIGDAPPPPAPFVTDHKWLDPECHASGCQTLILKAELEKLRDQRDKYMWQVRDTCRRAEAAEAEGQKVCRYGNDCPDVGGPCPACDGTGAQDDGDPEIGQRLTNCDRCDGTGKAAPPPPARDVAFGDLVKELETATHHSAREDEIPGSSGRRFAARKALLAAIEALRAERDELLKRVETLDQVRALWDECHEKTGRHPSGPLVALEERAEAAEAENKRLREAVTFARDTFRAYAALHLAKNTYDGRMRARANENNAEAMQCALDGKRINDNALAQGGNDG